LRLNRNIRQMGEITPVEITREGTTPSTKTDEKNDGSVLLITDSHLCVVPMS